MNQAEQPVHRFLFFEGIVFVILGIMALFLPVFFSYSFEIMFGIVFLIIGISEAIRVSQSRSWPGSTASLVSAVLFIVIGGWLCIFPQSGLQILTLLLSILFFGDGCFKIIAALQLRKIPSWWWYFIAGFVEIGTAIIIWNNWPYSATWFFGILIAINFLFVGITQILLANEAKKVSR